ncbi:MAG: ABC transporter transmembrane domain-containing protein [bacterium]
MTKPTSPKKQKSVSIWYLTRFMRPYLGLIILTLVFLLADTVAAGLQPFWLKKLIDLISKGTTLQAVSGILITYFAFKGVSAVFEVLRDVVFAPAEMGIARSVSDQLFTQLVTLPVGYHHEQRLGATSRKITRGGRAISFILDFLVINILPTIFQLLFVTALLFKLYAPVYAIVTFITIVGYTVFTIWATEKRQKFRVAANEADDEVSSIEVDTLSNIDTVKYFNNERQQNALYQPAIQNRYRLSVASNQLFAVISGVQGLILLAGLSLILYLGVRQNIQGEMTIGDLVLLTTYVAQLSAPIGVLGFIYRQIKDGLADLDGMARIMQEEITIIEPEHPTSIEKPVGRIEFKDVHFSYPSGREVLKGISLTVEPGQKVAFVGPSGVGKSTIVKLLFRLYETTGGQILVDGVPLEELSKDSRRDIFAIVPQEPVLFNASIAENIRFGKPDATMAEVEAAAKLANAHSFISHFDKGYETIVGERGVKLSGGEKQRVAIARSVVRDPKVLVFDEATSALDTHSEQIIQQSLDRVAEGRTTLAVAHRLSTIADADVIFVLKEGKIVEQGTHEQLLAKKGLFSQLWQLQIQQREEGDE